MISLASAGSNIYASAMGGGVYINKTIVTGINEQKNDNYNFVIFLNPFSGIFTMSQKNTNKIEI